MQTDKLIRRVSDIESNQHDAPIFSITCQYKIRQKKKKIMPKKFPTFTQHINNQLAVIIDLTVVC